MRKWASFMLDGDKLTKIFFKKETSEQMSWREKKQGAHNTRDYLMVYFIYVFRKPLHNRSGINTKHFH